jgi:hypothetical protein
MSINKTYIFHWLLGVPAVFFILVFAYVPISEFLIVFFSENNANRPIGNSQIWFMTSRSIFLIFNFLYGTINTVLLLFSVRFLIKKDSSGLLIVFAIFFSLFFFLFLLTGNWLQID